MQPDLRFLKNPDLWTGMNFHASPWVGPSWNRVFDYSGNQAHGLLTNMDPGTDWVQVKVRDRYGYALDFDGSNDVVAATSRKLITKYPFTLSSWVLFKALPASIYGMFFSVGVSNSAYCSMTGTNISGNLRFGLAGRNPGYTETYSAVNRSLNTWYHVVGVFENATTRRMYVDGRLAFQSAALTSIPEVSNGFGIRVGSQFLVYHTNSQVADAIAWDRGLSPTDVQQLYHIGPGGLFEQSYKRLGYVAAGPSFKNYWLQKSRSLIGGGVR